MLAAERILALVGRPVKALAAIPLETRRFEDLGALSAVPLETRRFEDLSGYLFEPMLKRVGVAQQQMGEPEPVKSIETLGGRI